MKPKQETTIQEVEKILARTELQKKIIEKMLEKVNDDYKEQKLQIQKKSKAKK